MPSLRESQLSMRRWLLHEADGDAAHQILSGGIAPRQRLNIYRNTILSTLSKGLQLTFPAVQRLVGADFFDAGAQAFAREHPPLCADLNRYGAEFPDFLQQLDSAATLAYLPDVARLDWAVSRALHAADASALEMASLEALDPGEQDRVCFVPHPSISMLKSTFPVDTIWHAVLQQDDSALAAIDLKEGPAFLLVERVADQVVVHRLDAAAWSFAEALFGGDSLATVLGNAPDVDAPALIASHLIASRCISFHVAPLEVLR